MKIAGGAMLKVKDIMTRELITVSPETEIVHATKLLLENRINGVPVTDETGKLVGILCQSDLIAQQKKLPIPSFFTLLNGLIPLTSKKQIEKQVRKIAAITVAQCMTPNPVTVKPDMDIEEIWTSRRWLPSWWTIIFTPFLWWMRGSLWESWEKKIY